MAKCQQCAAPILPADRFCTACGSEVGPTSTVVIPDVQTSLQRRRPAWLYLLVVGVGVIAVGAVAAFIVMSNGSGPTTVAAPPTLSVPGTPQGQQGGDPDPPEPAVTVTMTSRPQVTRTVLIEPTRQGDVGIDSLDPCDGGEFPFSAQLETVAAKPGSLGRREIATKNVQMLLRNLGYLRPSGEPLVVDGWFGEETKAAVREFQRASGIDDSGTVYLQTWPLLGQVGAEQGVC